MPDSLTIKVAPRLTFWAPDGSPVPVKNVGAEATYDDDRLVDFQISFALDPDEWADVDARGLFHLAPEVRGPTFAGGFEPEPDIEIDARLDGALLAYLAERSADVFEAAALLLDAEGPDGPLVRTEDWFALVVKQQRGHLKTGFATRYSGLLE